MSSSFVNSNNSHYQELEAKRQQNIEDNRRFLAALKISDIHGEIKELANKTSTEDVKTNTRRALQKDTQPDVVRRGSRVRKNIIPINNILLSEEKPKKTKKRTDENCIRSVPKVKIELPDHMLIRYQSTSKKVALHNTKAKFGDDISENTLM